MEDKEGEENDKTNESNRTIEINPLKELQPRYTYLVTLIIFSINVLVAICVSDMGVVFSFIGSISGNSLSFIFPSAIYLKIISDRKKKN